MSIVGIDADNPAALLPGLSPEGLQTWLAYDDLARKFGEYADPPFEFDVAERVLVTGATVAVIQVREFSDSPILCARDFPNVLRKGACYVRPRRVPETAEIATSVEMRELLDLATEKALRAYVETAQRAGVVLRPRDASPTHDQLFDQQRRDVW